MKRKIEIESNAKDISTNDIEQALTSYIDRNGLGSNKSESEFLCDTWIKAKEIHPAASERHPASEKPEENTIILIEFKRSKKYEVYEFLSERESRDGSLFWCFSNAPSSPSDTIKSWAYILEAQ